MVSEKRTHIASEIKPELNAKEVIIAGWAHEIRPLGGLKFLVVRDRSGTVQITAPKKKVSEDVFAKIDTITPESVVKVKGIVQESAQAPNGVEIIPLDIDILSLAHAPLPFDMRNPETGLDTRFDNRFLDLRKEEIRAIFKVKAEVAKAAAKYLDEQGFISVQTPKITKIGAESGAELFHVNYFDEDAFLAQSPQIYKQMMQGAGFEKVYEIAPVFRAENSNTNRHVTEFTGIDGEISFIESDEDVYALLEDMFRSILVHVKNTCKDELKLFNAKIEIPKNKFPRITIREAYELLNENGHKCEIGQDLNREEEKILAEIVKEKHKTDFFFLTEFPWDKRPFYTMRKESEPQWTLSGDLEWKGDEMVTGGIREHRYDILMKQAKEKNAYQPSLDPYLNMFKYGFPPEGGFGAGLDRIVMKILDLENIREAILFPRDPERLLP
ncbi:MAG: aspartate--tRNA(Asn) ligase [Candidatus Diapherotrites archaeon]|nr:aspartate--tRNA(Asn) ligase [Candidatus Diapherotrites archaeon]